VARRKRLKAAYGLTVPQLKAMHKRFQKAARKRLYEREKSRDLRDWAMARAARMMSAAHGRQYPNFRQLRKEFEPPQTAYRPSLLDELLESEMDENLGGLPMPAANALTFEELERLISEVARRGQRKKR
jgi:hypothetical protein